MGDNIPTGSWPASRPTKDIIFSVMLPICLDSAHLFSYSPALPNLAGSCLNCLCLSVPFPKSLGAYLRYTITSSSSFLLLSLIPTPAVRVGYQDCNLFYIYTPLLFEWELSLDVSLEGYFIMIFICRPCFLSEYTGSMLMFTINILIPTGFA